jgi:hypothetical protein
VNGEWSTSKGHIFEEGGKAIDIFPEEPCGFGKRPELVACATVEVLGLPAVTAWACFDERAFALELLWFFMQQVVNVPRFSTTSAYDVHGVFLHVSGL